ncbi:hypothetical protein K438DRAFT_1864302 [Mycena galopus ATCC 62051]|nr:hypothetical protein K438DRAFT_1864302 [Mycena galopus ATCC 62051]
MNFLCLFVHSSDLRVKVRFLPSIHECFLEDEEIIEHLVHNETRRIHWTMHRPRNGWYIRIRSPAFPPGSRTNVPIQYTSVPPPFHARRRC